MSPVRVATYNTRDFRDDTAAAARVVRSIDPDVLCLQEVPRRLFAGGRVARFATHCGMRWVGRHRGSGGTTILVSERVALDASGHHRLATALLDRTRGYAVARLRSEDGSALTVVSVHLSLREGERERHADHVLDALATMPGAVVVAGDLNESADGAARSRFAANLRVVSPPDPTYPAAEPRLALDVIFGSPEVRVVPGARVALDEGDVRSASDHRPSWVDIEVPAGSAEP